VRGIGDVPGDGMYDGPAGEGFGCDGQAALLAGVDHQVPPAVGECLGEGAAETTGGTGHEGSRHGLILDRRLVPGT
jgi:hypothetical protein